MESIKVSASFRVGSKMTKIVSYTRKGLSINYVQLSKAGDHIYLVLRNRKQLIATYSVVDSRKVFSQAVFKDVYQMNINFSAIEAGEDLI